MKNNSLIDEIIQNIEENLNQKINLDQLAQHHHYSKYHLHRLFTHTVGMTMHDYIQRRQLTEGAKLLVFSNRPILDIALLSGYESQQAFTNAFTAMYKQPPKRFREQGQFYPLQLPFRFGEHTPLIVDTATPITFADTADIPLWMDLVTLVIDGFPYFNEAEYKQALKGYILRREALIMKEHNSALGILLFSRRDNSIDFWGIHPLHKGKNLHRQFLQKVLKELKPPLTTTTYRAGDKADMGQRETLIKLGFVEGELLTELGYPTQAFILRKEASYE